MRMNVLVQGNIRVTHFFALKKCLVFKRETNFAGGR